MILTLIALAALPTDMRILMLGNSHTANNNVPGQLAAMLNGDGGPHASVTMRAGMFLNDIAENPSILNEIKTGDYDVVILQAAKLSNSHKYHYSHEGGMNLAKLAQSKGARVLYYAEWPRKGWNETDYILGIYGEIKKGAGCGEIVPVCRVWDMILAKEPKAELWGPDGNHASPRGSTLAAYTLYYWVRRSDKSAPGKGPDVAYARAVWQAYGSKKG